MCLIIAVEDSRDMPLHQFEMALESAIPFNPDGIGLTYGQDGKAEIVKHSKCYGAVLDKALDLYRYTSDPFVVHLRYSTVGRNSLANTHPFRINSKVAMVHNKTLDIEPPSQAWSDSRTVAELLRRLCKADSNFYGSTLFHSFIEHQAGLDNRFVFLDAEENILTYVNEDLGIWKDGVWFSNLYAWSPGVVGIKRPSTKDKARAKLEQLPGAQDEDDLDLDQFDVDRYGNVLPMAWENYRELSRTDF